nr:hypothetical protein Iba_scaffold29944CG0010 [Ipomoea batatas]GME03864.1 hypothetical protein Iba_scaffold1393CG0410 [Ipomoea batatas]
MKQRSGVGEPEVLDLISGLLKATTTLSHVVDDTEGRVEVDTSVAAATIDEAAQEEREHAAKEGVVSQPTAITPRARTVQSSNVCIVLGF